MDYRSRTKRIADVTAGCTGVHCFFGSTDRRQMSFQFFLSLTSLDDVWFMSIQLNLYFFILQNSSSLP